MAGPDPCVAKVRVAVRAALDDLAPTAPVGVALSGGPDSLALLAATIFVRVGTVAALVVDHAWHEGSAAAAAQAAAVARQLGATSVEVIEAPSPRSEAAARAARYAALEAAAARLELATVLLGHTRDDQAESVLLGLARGSGARSLAGMAARRGVLRRPLLGIDATGTRAACTALGLTPYDDPANHDPAFLRTRLRSEALPALTAALGRDVSANLARSARLLRDDADALDGYAAGAAADAGDPHTDGMDCALLAALPAAVRRRVLHSLGAGLTGAHVDALDALVTSWRGQGPVALPGGVLAGRRSGRIHLSPPREAG